MFKTGILQFESIVDEPNVTYKYVVQCTIYEDLSREIPIYYLQSENLRYKQQEKSWIPDLVQALPNNKPTSITSEVICNYTEKDIVKYLSEVYSGYTMEWLQPLTEIKKEEN